MLGRDTAAVSGRAGSDPAPAVTASQPAKTAIPIATPIDAAFFSANCAVTEAAFRAPPRRRGRCLPPG